MDTNKRKIKPTTFYEIFKILFQHSRQIRYLIPVELFFLLLDGFLASRIPAFIKYIIDSYQAGHQNFIDQYLYPSILYGASISLGWYIAASIQHFLKEINSTTIMVNVQLSLYKHMQNLSVEFFQNSYVGEITNRLTNDIYQSVKEIYFAFTNFIWLLGLIIPSMITMAGYDLRFFFIFLGIMIFFSIILTLLMPVIRKMYKYSQDQMGIINAKITESIYSIMLIKSFAKEENVSEQVHNESKKYLHKTLKTGFIRIISYDFMLMTIGYLAPIMILCLGVVMGLTISTIIAFFSYWFTVGQRIQNIINLSNRIIVSLASFDRVYELFQQTPIVKDEKKALKLIIKEGKIVFENVSFSYPGLEQKKVLKEFNISIPSNKKTAIIGKSGSGKTTIFNLLLRFFDPLAGRILIDNQDIRYVSQKSLRSMIGLVMQEIYLLNGTVRENMQFVLPEAKDKQIIEALKKADIWNLFLENGEGLDTIIGERGIKLSGGQRQRISIARIFLKNPLIILFDEATSALDSETEQKILDTMEKAIKGRTSIIVTHRLSTINKCQNIIVIDQGTLVGQGTHKELIKSCSLYKDLYTHQELQR